MINSFKVLGFFAVISIGIFGCSATQETSSSQTKDTSDTVYPSWYQKTAFIADSVSFTGYGEAIGADSVSAIQNAELQARVNLESGVSGIVEETRATLSEKGNDTVNDPEFLILLRNASQAIQGEGVMDNKTAVNTNGYYRGYASVKINRSKAISTIRSGFEENVSYWEILSAASLFE